MASWLGSAILDRSTRTTGTTWGSRWWTSFGPRAGANRPPRAKFGAELGEVTIAGERVLLCKPMEFMNVSGQAVARVAGFWKVPVAEVIVVHDELDLPFGRLKLGAGGGHGGHNGVRSLLADLGDAALRARARRHRPPDAGPRRRPTTCSRTSRAPRPRSSPSSIGTAADAVEAILKSGLTGRDEQVQRKRSEQQQDTTTKTAQRPA